ncbi:MAG: hypothetical protein NDI61_12885 [Bdellovibrionaceae bacterium]|nr:hypothetical protein [Pseudobdellovibrionaceae bacterium]
MSWSEGLYQKAEKWIHGLNQKRQGLGVGADLVRLDDMKSTLHLWAALLSGRNWTIQESEDWPSRDPERLYLPPQLEIFGSVESNRRAYFYIVSNLVGADEAHFPELMRWRKLLQQDSILIELQHPLAYGLLMRTEPVLPLVDPPAHDLGQPNFKNLLHLWVANELQPQRHSRDMRAGEGTRAERAKTEKKKAARNRIQIVQEMNKPEADNPLVHSFEKLHTADDYNGGQKQQDGDDELADHAEALEELDLRQVIRSPEATRATLKGDFAMDIEVADSAEDPSEAGPSHILYPEWSEKRQTYLENWARVESAPVKILGGHSRVGENGGSASDFSSADVATFNVAKVKKAQRREIEALRKCFHTLFQSPKWKTRQSDGAEIDIDAVIDLLATPAGHRGQNLQVYMDRRKDLDPLSLVILFDRSLSSDSWIENRRVLDTIRESLVIIGSALEKFPLDVQLACFSSFTRSRVCYDVVKDFSEPWRLGFERLPWIEPQGYTRIGAALRHASAQLQERRGRHKWIILLSDAKPTDYDAYEGRHGVRDVRKAIAEAKAYKIGVRCLSIEKSQRQELAEMFGLRGYELLLQPGLLPLRLGALLRSLVQAAR